mmetsp:Transcript_48003/g.108996  ORF Transcript_48003/g.108996 Transcript_48003/m.108996 type:complete len:81 (-) Transcript_48003:206-448(-)
MPFVRAGRRVNLACCSLFLFHKFMYNLCFFASIATRSVETLTQFNARMEKKFPNQPGAGHVFVKLKGKALEDKLKPRAAN